ncbi:MAG: DUF1549 and DUF1553 domain-containing protein [Planctomyces sp.]|jgi:hypothetical protein|nr:DUF1549 and DUF1553 domain-containing protein [Planctomyces sp.]
MNRRLLNSAVSFSFVVLVLPALALQSLHGVLLADEVVADEVVAGRPAAAAGAEVSLGEFIDQQIRQGWTDNEIEASPLASDEEWVRRVYLDLVGRIPTLTEAREFLADKNPRKRAMLVDALLENEDYVRNFTTIWANNSIGRGAPQRVSRTGMEKFYREAFAKNRPWNEIVVDILTASGHYEENGAVNYILAQMQMPDDAVQLTAMTTRLFLGLQVQCTQCHNHPFNKWQQDQFWEFNSFFRQVDKRDHRKLDPKTGQQVDDYSEVVWKEFTGPVYYEKRSGMMQVAFPRFQGHEVDPGVGVDRRSELAKLITEPAGDEPAQLAQAMVNRTWSHFFGYGFTRPVDDMGPHNPASHPELLKRLSREFVAANYDVKQLIRWIVSSEAYQLSSQYGEKNRIDDPAAGEMPLFSHMYLKSMQAEQLYDSLIVASNAHQSGNGSWSAQEEQRRRWMQQFVVAFDNDENDESTTFNGTIPQALMMMNSELIDKACSVERGSFLFEQMSSPGAETQKINDLYMAALTRRPTRAEMTKMQKALARYGAAKLNGYQDMFWALLNSNEFIFIH